MKELKKFSKATGLKENSTKCEVYFGGVPKFEQKEMIDATSFFAGTLLFKFLRVKLSSRKMIVHQCRSLIDKIVLKFDIGVARMRPLEKLM